MAECGPVEGCGYTTKVTYTICDPNGKEVDKTCWEEDYNGDLQGSLLMKYAFLSHVFSWREEEARPPVASRVMGLLFPR